MKGIGSSTLGGVGALASGAFVALPPLVLVKSASLGERLDLAHLSFALALLIAGPWLAGTASAVFALLDGRSAIPATFAVGSALPAFGASFAAIGQGSSIVAGLLLLALFHAGFSYMLASAGMWTKSAQLESTRAFNLPREAPKLPETTAIAQPVPARAEVRR